MIYITRGIDELIRCSKNAHYWLVSWAYSHWRWASNVEYGLLCKNSRSWHFFCFPWWKRRKAASLKTIWYPGTWSYLVLCTSTYYTITGTAVWAGQQHLRVFFLLIRVFTNIRFLEWSSRGLLAALKPWSCSYFRCIIHRGEVSRRVFLLLMWQFLDAGLFGERSPAALKWSKARSAGHGSWNTKYAAGNRRPVPSPTYWY